jgi:hypothetical protein
MIIVPASEPAFWPTGSAGMSVAAGSMQAVTAEIEMAFPDWPRRKLKRAAENHAADAALSRGHTPGDAPVERLVVNMLRHEFTSYDRSQSQEAHRAVCEAIAARFGVGMRVTATVRGHRREATVVKIGRSRVTVMFQIKSGAVRTAQLYARDVQPDFR